MFHTEQDQTRDLQPVGCKKVSWRDKCSSLPIGANGKGSVSAGWEGECRPHLHKGVLMAVTTLLLPGVTVSKVAN